MRCSKASGGWPRSGLFRRVRIVDIPHQTSADRDVLVEVEESPSTTIDYGGGVEAGRRMRLADSSGRAEERIEVAPRGFFQISRRNLFGKNRSISLFTRVSLRPRDPAVDSTDPLDVGGYGFNEYRVVGTFREPRLIDSPGDLLLTTFFEQGIRSSFNFSRRGVRAEYARRFGPVVTVSGRYAIDRTRLFDEKIRAGGSAARSIACFRRSGCRRSPDRCCATRATTSSIPSAARCSASTARCRCARSGPKWDS